MSLFLGNYAEILDIKEYDVYSELSKFWGKVFYLFKQR